MISAANASSPRSAAVRSNRVPNRAKEVSRPPQPSIREHPLHRSPPLPCGARPPCRQQSGPAGRESLLRVLPKTGGDQCVYLAGPWGSLLTALAAQRRQPLGLLVGPWARQGRATAARFSCGRLPAAADTTALCSYPLLQGAQGAYEERMDAEHEDGLRGAITRRREPHVLIDFPPARRLLDLIERARAPSQHRGTSGRRSSRPPLSASASASSSAPPRRAWVPTATARRYKGAS